MRLHILVKTNSKTNKINKIDDSHYEVWVKEPAKEGRANSAVIAQMAKYIKIPKSRITLLKGAKFKQKLIEIK